MRCTLVDRHFSTAFSIFGDPKESATPSEILEKLIRCWPFMFHSANVKGEGSCGAEKSRQYNPDHSTRMRYQIDVRTIAYARLERCLSAQATLATSIASVARDCLQSTCASRRIVTLTRGSNYTRNEQAGGIEVHGF
jgi:hypothetical protein